MRHALTAILTAATLVAVLIPSTLQAEARGYKIDRSHATVSFRVSHLGFSDTLAVFRKFSADIRFDPENPVAPENRVDFVIDAASIDTNWERRDEHIRGGDFLDVANHPEIRFVSTGIEELEDDGSGSSVVRLTGDLTIRGATRPAEFEVVMNRRGEMRGKEVIGFEATGRVDRREFGIDFAAPAIGAILDVWISLEVSPVP